MSAPNDFSSPPNRALIALGANIEPERHLTAAVELMGLWFRVVATSRVWQSRPVGFAAQADFLNAAALIETRLTAWELRQRLRAIEAELGRVRDSQNKNGPRTIDLDVAIFNGEWRHCGAWQLPDPHLHRPFVAVPLAELAPDWVVPGRSGAALASLAAACASAPMVWRSDVVLPASAPAPVERGGERAQPLAGGARAARIPTTTHPHPAPMSAPIIELRFCYGHRLLNYLGKCRHLHGHSARVELTLDESFCERFSSQHSADESLAESRATGDSNGGAAEALADIAARIEQWVRENLDARMVLSEDDPALADLEALGERAFLLDCNPTTENIARLLLHRARQLGAPVRTSRMWESPRCSAMCCEPSP